MCGIAGIWNFTGKVNPKTLERFTVSLKHRGPDGIRFYHDDSAGIGLGHNRLAILDLSDQAAQPMAYADGRYHITYNGEIFNFLELKKELEGYGYVFRSLSDTEVILASYHRWKEACLDRFNGMFAFAVWDAKEKKLFLARDRFGVKPLYYMNLPGRIFAFASETIAFSSLDNYKREFNEANISAAIEDVFCLEGRGETIFKDIRQILPGHFLIVSSKGEAFSSRWWSTLDHVNKVTEPYELQVEKFKHIFKDACAIRMRSDVPIASALSGGVDSSAVYCMLHHVMSRGNIYERTAKDWHRAFVATFPGAKTDESKYAAEVIKYTNGDVTYLAPNSSNLAKDLVEATVKSDFIYLTPDIASNIYSGMRKNGIKVSLDGHGADEMLLGYQHLIDAARHVQSRNAKRSKLYYRIYDGYIPAPIKRAYNKLRGIFGGLGRNTSWLLPRKGALLENKASDGKKLLNMSEADQALYVNFHETTLPTILRNFDRASMKSGVEIRMPFMDWRLVTYIFSLPLASKIRNGCNKKILRDAMAGLMPESIRMRKLKIGLNAPMTEWFSNELGTFISDELNSADFLKSNIWNGPLIRDFAQKKIADKSWQWDECTRFWPYLNAHILIRGKA